MKEEKKRILEENKAAQARTAGYLKKLGGVILLLLFFSFVNKWFHKENPSPTPKPPAECVALESLQSESEVEKAVSNCWKGYFATYDTATSLLTVIKSVIISLVEILYICTKGISANSCGIFRVQPLSFKYG